jgi:23S rRNA (adenine2030-N6)-methyltransferase
LNYRHAFHAGNFADLVKHAALLELLGRLTAAQNGKDAGPLTVIDTHAGRGVYDLAGPEARKSGEAEAGIARLMAARDAPPEFAGLTAAVRKLNPGGAVRRYPGSPWLIAEALRPGDDYLACELRPDEHGALSELMKGRHHVRTLCADGYDTAVREAAARTERGAGRLLVLIDPPFEQSDDYRRIVETIAGVRTPGATFLVWLPLKDLETFDAFLRSLPDRTPGLIVEARMRPLTDPMKMNGCALALIPGPLDLQPALQAIGDWTVGTLGEGGVAKVYRL